MPRNPHSHAGFPRSRAARGPTHGPTNPRGEAITVDDEHRNERYLEAPLDPALLPWAEAIAALAVQLRGLDLIDEENIGVLRANAALGVWAIEADHPDGGPWLYGREDVDTITATRMRLDGQREHAVLDEYGMPTEWRVAIQPEFN